MSIIKIIIFASLTVKGVARVEGETRGSTDPLVVSLSLSH